MFINILSGFVQLVLQVYRRSHWGYSAQEDRQVINETISKLLEPHAFPAVPVKTAATIMP